MVVVLPAALGPRNAKNSPWGMSRFRLSTARRLPNDLLKEWVWITMGFFLRGIVLHQLNTEGAADGKNLSQRGDFSLYERGASALGKLDPVSLKTVFSVADLAFLGVEVEGGVDGGGMLGALRNLAQD